MATSKFLIRKTKNTIHYLSHIQSFPTTLSTKTGYDTGTTRTIRDHRKQVVPGSWILLTS